MTVWLDKASALADDLVKSEAGGEEYRFRVATRALAVCVGLRGKLDPAPWIDQAVDSGKDLIAAAADPVCKSHLQWDLGMALYDAMQVCQTPGRSGRGAPLRRDGGRLPGKGLPAAALPPTTPTCWAGSTSTSARSMPLGDKNHRLAVGWFDKALPLLEKTPADQIADARPPRRIAGEHGRVVLGDGPAQEGRRADRTRPDADGAGRPGKGRCPSRP